MTVVTADQVVKTGPIDVTITRDQGEHPTRRDLSRRWDDGQYLLVFRHGEAARPRPP